MRNRRWIIFWISIQLLELVLSEESISSRDSNSNDNGEANFQNIFSPRMDYEQWKPLGRGDPLKHDPTFDYVPPVLDRVQYWVDPAMRKPDPPIPGETQKTEILLLGVTSKKPASSPIQADSRRDTFDPFIKYVEGPKFSPNPNRRIANPAFFPSPSSFFPSFFPPNKIKYMDNIPFSKGVDQRVPSTILMPPPLNSDFHTPSVSQKQPPTESTTFSSPSSSFSETPASSVSLQTSNLVYHSTSGLSTDTTLSNQGNSFTPTVNFEPSITTSKSIPDFRDELIYNTHLTPPESFIRIQFAPLNFSSKPLLGSDTNQHISYVTPPPLIKTNDSPIMFKGKVTDDDISNTYVKIGKSEAEVISPELNTVIQHPIPNMVMFPHSGKPKESFEPKLPPLTMQTLHEMQEMHPPPVTQIPMFQKTTNNIFKLLDREKSSTMMPRPFQLVQSSSSNSFETTSESTTTSTTMMSTTTEEPTTTLFVNIFTTTQPTTSSTTTTSTTTASQNLNSAPKYFKQQMKPMKSPVYLIIQGHSKVKTYGPSKQMHGILIQDTNEITDGDDKYNLRKNLEGKSLQDYTLSLMDNMSSREGKSRNLGNIQTLKHVVQTGLGAIDLSDLPDDIERSEKDFQEAELHVGYEVGKNKDMTEKYHKGIVEAVRKLKV